MNSTTLSVHNYTNTVVKLCCQSHFTKYQFKGILNFRPHKLFSYLYEIVLHTKNDKESICCKAHLCILQRWLKVDKEKNYKLIREKHANGVDYQVDIWVHRVV